MNIYPSVFDRKCPDCGESIEFDLKSAFNDGSHGRPDLIELNCYRCGFEYVAKVEWGVIWLEIEVIANGPS